MSTKILAYNFKLLELRYHKISLDVPDYERLGDSGSVLIDTNLRFGISKNSLLATTTMNVSLVNSDSGEESGDEDPGVESAASLVLVSTGRFELPPEHGISNEDLNSLKDEEVASFGRILEPHMLGRAKSLLEDAGLDGSGIPLQLADPQ